MKRKQFTCLVFIVIPASDSPPICFAYSETVAGNRRIIKANKLSDSQKPYIHFFPNTLDNNHPLKNEKLVKPYLDKSRQACLCVHAVVKLMGF